MPVKKTSDLLFKIENRLSEITIALLMLFTLITVITGFGVFSLNNPTKELLTPLIQMKYLGNALYQWILMLSFSIIARELWLMRRR